MERLEREDLLHSLALATNKSANSDRITEESRALINLDSSYGVKMQGQFIEQDFKYKNGFTNIKNKKIGKRRQIPELAGLEDDSCGKREENTQAS